MTTFARLSEQTNQSADAASGETSTSAKSSSTGGPADSRSSAGIQPVGADTAETADERIDLGPDTREAIGGPRERGREGVVAVAWHPRVMHKPLDCCQRRTRPMIEPRCEALSLLLLGHEQPPPGRLDGLYLRVHLGSQAVAFGRQANGAHGRARRRVVQRGGVVQNGGYPVPRHGDGSRHLPVRSVSAIAVTEDDLQARVAEQVAERITQRAVPALEGDGAFGQRGRRVDQSCSNSAAPASTTASS